MAAKTEKIAWQKKTMKNQPKRMDESLRKAVYSGWNQQQ